MKVAALDLGSNTFLCLICEVENGFIKTVYADEVQVVRLGQGLNASKKFHPEALVRAQKTLIEFSDLIKKHNPDKISAMATSAARDAENKNELFDICNNLGIPLKIISGDQEAIITYSGSVSNCSEDPDISRRLVLDIGGGSTEFIIGAGNKLINGHSQNIGCVRLTEKFITAQPTPYQDILDCKKYIHEIICESKIKLIFEPDQILAVAGTPTALVAAELGYFEASKIDGFILTKQKVEDWVNRLSKASVDEKINMGIPAGRADVILVGAIILLVTMEVFNKNEITVSTRGVRYGIALQMES